MVKEEFTSEDGWIFRYDEVSGYEVIPKEDNLKQRPNTLFKYYSMNQNSVDSLVRSCLYGSNPELLNDPFDCNYEIFQFESAELVFGIMNNGRLANPEYTIEFIKEELAKTESHFIKSVKNLYKDLIFSKLGVLSLTNAPCNELMWAYYSNHRGFCLEFDYTTFGFASHGPFPINYSSNLNKVPVSEEYQLIPALYMTTLKNKNWAHEKEWRILMESVERTFMELPSVNRPKSSEQASRKFPYNREALRSITLGYNFFNVEFEWGKQEGLTVEVKLNPPYGLRVAFLNCIIAMDLPLFMMIPIRKESRFCRLPVKIQRFNTIEYKFELGTVDHCPPM